MVTDGLYGLNAYNTKVSRLLMYAALLECFWEKPTKALGYGEIQGVYAETLRVGMHEWSTPGKNNYFSKKKGVAVEFSRGMKREKRVYFLI